MAPINSIVEAFQSLLSFIGDILTWIGSFFVECGKIIMSGLQWFYDVLLKPFFDTVGSFFQLVGDFLSGLWDFFVNLLKWSFVPSNDYFTNIFNNIHNVMSKKLGIDLSTFETMRGISQSNPLDPIDFTVLGFPVTLNLSFIKTVVPYSQAISNGLCAIFLCWYHYKNAYKLVRGTSPIESNGGGNKN